MLCSFSCSLALPVEPLVARTSSTKILKASGGPGSLQLVNCAWAMPLATAATPMAIRIHVECTVFGSIWSDLQEKDSQACCYLQSPGVTRFSCAKVSEACLYTLSYSVCIGGEDIHFW